VIIVGDERPRVLTFCILDVEKSYVLKNDFGDVDETMFQGVEMPYELVFCILGSRKVTFN
jgi:hypothetical protein